MPALTAADQPRDRAPAAARAPLVLWDIVDESLDEAGFLWGRRESALEAPDQTPEDVVARIEDRLLGAVDGLCVPGGVAIDRVLGPALDSGDASVVAVAAHALLAGGTPEGAVLFAETLLRAAGDQLQSLRRGLQLVTTAATFLRLAPSMRDAPAAIRAAFLEACSFCALPLEPRFGDLLVSPEASLQRAGARLLRHAPRTVGHQWIPRALDLQDRCAREAAVETGLIIGARGAWAGCRELALADINGSGALLVPLAMLGAPRDHDAVLSVLGQSRRQGEAAFALGFGGRRSGADACVELLAQDRHVRLAAEALVAITGLNLRTSGLMVAPPLQAGSAAGLDGEESPSFEEEDLDADLIPRAVDLLPMPDIPGVIRWWNRNRSRFDPDTRYLAGRPAHVGLLLEALSNGPMRRRHALALELAVRTEGRVQVQTRAFIPEQRRQLATFDAGSIPALARSLVAGSLAAETSPWGGR